MNYLFANNATSNLVGDTPAGSTTVTVNEGHGASFPQPTGDGSDGFTVTLEDRRFRQLEVCWCTMRNDDILVVTRGQEMTLAQDFKKGATVSHRTTAKTLFDLQELALNTEAYTKPEADSKFVWKTGDSMSGPLGVPAPTVGLHATNKDYVDSLVSELQTTINAKEPLIIAGLPEQYWAGDKTWRNFPTSGGGGGGGGGAGTGLVAVGDSPPAPAIDNQLWWQSSSGILALRYNDGTGMSQWVQVNISPSGAPPPPPVPVLGLVDMSDNAPSTPVEGQQWWETDTGHMFVRFGGAWVQTNSSIASVGEAPLDGQAYERKSGGWSVAAAAGVGFPEAPTTGLNYLRKGSTGAWVAGLPLTGGDLSGPISATGYRTKQGLSAGFGGNWFNFYWTGARIQAWIDNYNAGDIAYVGDLGAYVPKSGGTMTGQLNVNASIVANYVQAAYSYFSANLPVGSATYVVTGNNTGNGGGVLGYSGSSYGILGYNLNYTLYGNNTIYTSNDVQANTILITSTIQSINGKGIFGGTTTNTNSSNCNITTGGALYRTVASTLAVKRDIEPLWDAVSDAILKLKPIFHRYTIKHDHPDNWSFYSFGAEEVAEVDPRFANYDRAIVYDESGQEKRKHRRQERLDPTDATRVIEVNEEDGYELAEEESPQHINWPAITTALVALVQRLEKRISALEASHGA